MARIVRHEQTGAIKIEPSDKPVWVCACGLSTTFPLCDKSHKKCIDETPGRLYAYTPEGRTDIGPDTGVTGR